MAVVVPTEDTVHALLDYLVDPFLPASSTSVRDRSPSLSLQKSIANQMHAVVLLYNYYHRKQHPKLKYLDFESFIKMSVNAKPNLLFYMKFMQRCNTNEPEEVFSLTEKAIMDACNISGGLEALRDAPSMLTWPVSKVVIFLVDNMKKNCVLLFSSITEGVWSPIEKMFDDSIDELDGKAKKDKSNTKKRILKRPLVDELNSDEASFQNLAFLAIKETTGIDQACLMVLERHIVPSLSAEKTAACLYLVQYTRPLEQDLSQVPIEDAINSLQGPLVKKELGGYTISTVVEYFHLLPYASILADWFSRANQESIDAECSPLADDSATLSTKESSNKVYGTSRTDGNLGQTTQNITTGKVTQDKKGNSSRTDTQDKDYVNISKRMNSSPEVDLSIGKKLKPCEEGDLDLHKKMESTAEGDLIGNSTQEQEVERVMVSHDSRSSTKDGERNDNSNMDFSSQAAIQTGDHSSVPLPSISQNRNDIPTMSSKMHELVHTFVAMLHMKRDELSHQQRLLEDAIALCEKNLRTVSSGEGDLMLKVNSLIEACNVATNSATGHTHTETHQQIETRSLPKEKTRKNLSEANLVLTDPVKELDAICCDYIWTLLRYYLSQKNLLGWKSTVTVKAMDFEYSGSGQDYYPHRSKVSGARDILTKLREIELDRICYQNNWILPRYAVVPTNGGFSASVVVQGMDFECLCTGDVESHPREARESAAKHVWTKLHNMAIEAKRNEVNGTPSLN